MGVLTRQWAIPTVTRPVLLLQLLIVFVGTGKAKVQLQKQSSSSGSAVEASPIPLHGGPRVERRVLLSEQAEASVENAVGRVETLEKQLVISKQHDPMRCSMKCTPVPPVFDSCELQLVGGRKSDNYGAWPMCYNHVPSNATVYSFGIGYDVSFDIAMIKQKGAKVFGFDPTIAPLKVRHRFYMSDALKLWPSFSFMQVGLGTVNGVVTFLKNSNSKVGSRSALPASSLKGYNTTGMLAAVLTLPTIMRALDHEYIDVLKIDVEGVEFDVCQSGPFLKAVEGAGQVLVEFHERILVDPTGRKDRCVSLLSQKGLTLVHDRHGEELVFARLKPNGTVTHLEAQ